jgi:predicted lipoprotein with Yx(FWY)xxD motif
MNQLVNRKTVLFGATAAVALAAAACGGSSGGTYGYGSSASPTPAKSTTSPAPQAPAAASGATIGSGASSLGKLLIDGSGRTVYLFEADKGMSSTCYGACASYWPPVLTSGTPVAGSGATASLLGTAPRTDGTTQVLYNGHPLYYFVVDKQAGDTKGEGLNNFGGAWYVVSPAGTKIDNS